MKNVWFLLILVGLCCFNGPVVNADYLNPPDWNDSNDFTHQTWDFGDDGEYGTESVFDMEQLPLAAAPDGEPNWVNDFGEPCLVDFNNTHEWMKGWYYSPPQLTTTRTAMYGGMGDSYLTFFVPNQQRQGFWQKQIWVQMTYFARKDGVKNYDVFIARDPNFDDTNGIYVAYEQLEEPNEPQGSTGKWYRLTSACRLQDQPGAEYIQLWVYNDPNPEMAASMIDQADIDTRCINLDLVEDGTINFCDYAAFAAEYLKEAPAVDLNPDGWVDKKDLSVLLQYWLEQNSP